MEHNEPQPPDPYSGYRGRRGYPYRAAQSRFRSEPLSDAGSLLKRRLTGHPGEDSAPESINANIFALTAKERKELNIDQLPGTLLEAVEELEKDTFIQDVLGDHIAGKYIDAKRKEWHEYRSQVSEWEIQEYLYKY